jgi:hypothetical protein
LDGEEVAMITVFVVFTVTFIAIWTLTDNKIISSIVWSLIMTSLLLWITFGIWGYDRNISKDYQVACEDIYSLSVTTEVNGSFVLGCGSIDSRMYYTFYIKDNSDLYNMSKVEVSRTSIKLDSSQTPKMIKVVYRYTATPCTIFGGDPSSKEIDTGKRILVVPSNTIRQEYKVN